MRTVVLIGPPGAGKSTVGVLVAELLGRQFIDVDDAAGPYYESVGQPVSELLVRAERDGFRAAHRWWQPARAAALEIVANNPGAIIALGAGHVHYEDPSYAFDVRVALGDAYVVMLLPDPDPTRSLVELRTRCEASKGSDWIRDGHDYLEEWVQSDQNIAAADRVIYASGRTPTQVADELRAVIEQVELHG